MIAQPEQEETMTTRPRARYTKTRHQGIYFRELVGGRRSYSVAVSDQGRTKFVTIVGGEQEAIGRRAVLLAAKGRGEKVAPSRILFADFANAWLADEKGRLAETTFEGYERALRLYLIPAFGNLRLNAVTADRVAQLIRDRKAAGAAPNTIRTSLVPLSRILNRAVRKGHIAANPIGTLEPSERPGLSRSQHRVLSRDEIGLLLRSTRASYRILVSTAVWTGLRQSELLGLTWADIDLDERIIRVRKQLSRKTMTRRDLKTGSSRRDVALAPTLVTMLAEHKVASPRSGPGDYVFSTRSGRPYGWRNVIRAALHDPLKTAGLHDPQPSWHDLRHTYASILISEGATSVEVCEQMGHADPSITMGVYAHQFESVKSADRVRGLLDGVLAGTMPSGEPVVLEMKR